MTERGGGALTPELLSILACPVCKGPLTAAEGEAGGLLCARCDLRYPVRDGIAILLADEAARDPA
jgi:uncharacterized protein YbaR (Trm112 family)